MRNLFRSCNLTARKCFAHYYVHSLCRMTHAHLNGIMSKPVVICHKHTRQFHVCRVKVAFNKLNNVRHALGYVSDHEQNKNNRTDDIKCIITSPLWAKKTAHNAHTPIPLSIAGYPWFSPVDNAHAKFYDMRWSDERKTYAYEIAQNRAITIAPALWTDIRLVHEGRAGAAHYYDTLDCV